MLVKDLAEKMDTHDEWVSIGDVNYLTYGGCQYRFSSKTQEFEIVRLDTPDCGFPGFCVGESIVMLSDILEEPDAQYTSKLSKHLCVDQLRPTKNAVAVGGRCSAEFNADDVELLIGAVISGWLFYYGADAKETYMFSTYGVDDKNVFYDQTPEFEKLLADVKSALPVQTYELTSADVGKTALTLFDTHMDVRLEMRQRRILKKDVGRRIMFDGDFTVESIQDVKNRRMLAACKAYEDAQ